MTAERAIADAELLDASKGQVRMLQGHLALLRGDAARAIKELEQATRLLPDNVSARALLGLAHAENGEYQKAFDRGRWSSAPAATQDRRGLSFQGPIRSLIDPSRA